MGSGLASATQPSVFGELEPEPLPKDNLEDVDRTTRHACAFSNSRGGFFVYGIFQRGTGSGYDVRGVPRDERDGEEIGERLKAEPHV